MFSGNIAVPLFVVCDVRKQFKWSARCLIAAPIVGARQIRCKGSIIGSWTSFTVITETERGNNGGLERIEGHFRGHLLRKGQKVVMINVEIKLRHC